MRRSRLTCMHWSACCPAPAHCPGTATPPAPAHEYENATKCHHLAVTVRGRALAFVFERHDLTPTRQQRAFLSQPRNTVKANPEHLPTLQRVSGLKSLQQACSASSRRSMVSSYSTLTRSASGAAQRSAPAPLMACPHCTHSQKACA